MGEPPSPASRWLALAGVCLGVFMFTLDGSVVNIAVPTLIRELRTTIGSVQWVIQAYLATVVVLLIPLSRVAARFGQKRVFLLGIAIFSTGSLLCGTAGSAEALIAFRIVQAIGAAGIASLMSSIVGAAFPPDRLAQALGIVTATATLGTSLGPTIGGFLIDAVSWHAIFLVNVPIGVAAFVLVLATLPRTSAAVKGPNMALADLAGLFRSRDVRVGIGGRLVSMMANGAFLFLTPLLLENALGYPTSKAGLFLAASPILIGIASPLFGALSDRHGRRIFLILGLCGMIGGLLVMHTLTASMSETGFLLRIALWGVGMGIFNAPNAATVMASAPRNLRDGVSALLSLAIILGQLLGVSAGGALFHALVFGVHGDGHSVAGLSPEALADAVAETLPLFALPLLAVLIASLRKRRPVQ